MAGHTELMVGAPVAATFSRSVDHVSRFLGLAVSNLYLLAAACTLWEVIARYVFNSPTQWVFEVVMVLCASAWMLSAGFVTLRKRHIGITVFYLMASDRVRWWLDLFAMVVGVFALYMLVSDTLIRALESIDLTERGGTAWNSPLPMVLKTVLVSGLFLYLMQLLVNLTHHFRTRPLQVATLAVMALICLRLLLQIFGHYGDTESLLYGFDVMLAENGSAFVDQFNVDRDAVGIATISPASSATGTNFSGLIQPCLGSVSSEPTMRRVRQSPAWSSSVTQAPKYTREVSCGKAWGTLSSSRRRPTRRRRFVYRLILAMSDTRLLSARPAQANPYCWR
mgnify:CR=1 FL=1